MKKPEPWPVTELRPRGDAARRAWRRRHPEAAEKRSICEPGGNSICRRSPSACEPASTLTRTEITAGFTFSTMSANPTGRWTLLRLAEVGERGRAAGSEAGAANRRRNAEAGDAGQQDEPASTRARAVRSERD